jgi:hypothetical protein
MEIDTEAKQAFRTDAKVLGKLIAVGLTGRYSLVRRQQKAESDVP